MNHGDDPDVRSSLPSVLTVPQSCLDLVLLKALADENRLRIIEALANGEQCVCELTADLGIAQSRLSFHLKVLRQSGVVADRQSGRWVYYRLQPQVFQQLQNGLSGLLAQSQQEASRCMD
ncbi:MAG: ArsR/SmtB family transcription factor [Synechococcus sp.]